MLTGDLFVFGDVRDVVREGWRGLRGEEVDTLVLGLAGTGIAVTAGMYASAGLAAPARAGLSVVKAARRGGHIGAPLVRLLKVEKREGLVQFVSDLGEVQSRTGMRGALDGLKIAEHPKDVAKLATPRRRQGQQDARDREGARARRDRAHRLAVHARARGCSGRCSICWRSARPASARSERMTLRHCERRRMRKLRCRTSAWQRRRGCLNGGVFNFRRVTSCRAFKNGNVEIAYLDEGEGDPIVLVHGFASNKEVNWVMPGWISTLTRDNRRVIALDNRGHGQSTKLYDPADYHTDMMAGDVAALIEHLGLAARRRDGLFARLAHQRRAGGAPSRAACAR